MFVAWHLKSGTPDLDTWLKWTDRRRMLVIQSVAKRVRAHNDQFDE